MTAVATTLNISVERRRRARRSYAAWLAKSIVIAILFLFPVYWTFIVALKTPEEIFAFPPSGGRPSCS